METENILKLETSLSESSDCTGLHELIVAVQEANQRCKELHINFVSLLQDAEMIMEMS